MTPQGADSSGVSVLTLIIYKYHRSSRSSSSVPNSAIGGGACDWSVGREARIDLQLPSLPYLTDELTNPP